MEAEHADLLDRRLMALYGIKSGRPNKVDQFGPETLAAIDADEDPSLPRPDRKHHRTRSSVDSP